MSETAEKLTEAMTEFVEAKLKDAGLKTGENEAKPTKRDVIVFVVFAANLALLMWSLPSEFLKSEQWEFYEKIIPAVGGSLFTVIVAWFKEKTLKVIQSGWFRWSQIPLAAVSLLLGAPVLPLHVKVEPADLGAILYVDKEDQDHLRDWKKTVWVSFAEHDVIAKHADPSRWNPRSFHWSRLDLIRMLWHRREVELPVLYYVRLNMPSADVAVNIQKIGTEFDEDYLGMKNLAEQHLNEMDRNRITLASAIAGDTSPLAKLPAGQYELTTWKTGCSPGRKVSLIVPPVANPENCKVDLEPPECPKP